jgi:iron complex transport system substrate-binding protein
VQAPGGAVTAKSRRLLPSSLSGPPRRIVSLVPSHTETLHGLGLADRVVGRTRFCIHPQPWVGTLPAVGGTKDASLEKVLALRPDLVVADRDENPKALVDGLEAAGVEVIWSDIGTVADAAAFVERLAERCGADEAGARWAERIRVRHAEVRREALGAQVPVFCPIWHPWMAFDATAYPHAMLEAVGLRNVLGAHAGPRYFEVTEEEVRAAGPEWTLLPTEPYPFHKRREATDTSGLGPAGRPERVRIVDGEALTWYGIRTWEGLEELARTARAIRSGAKA